MNKTEMISSPSGISSSTGSESDLHKLDPIDERKRKRKQSNRESAKRSRMRKQKHLDELTSQVTQLRKENGQIVAGISITTRNFVAMEAENNILRAQLLELNHRLSSLNEIVDVVESSSYNEGFGMESGLGGVDGGFYDHFNIGFYNQPIMASASPAGDVFNF